MAREKDPRYILIKELIESGSITTLTQAIALISLRQMERDGYVKYTTMRNKILHPNLLRLEDFIAIAAALGVTPVEIVALALKEYKPKKPIKKS